MGVGQQNTNKQQDNGTEDWDALKGDVGDIADAAVERSRYFIDSAREQATDYVDRRKDDIAQSVADFATTLREVHSTNRHDWAAAQILADQAVETVTTGQLEDYIMSALVHAVAARTALRRGAVPAAREHLARAARLRPLLTSAIPTLAVQTLLELGRAYLSLRDAAGVRAVLGQAGDVLRVRPELGRKHE